MDIKKRILALDIGTKRIGIAISDSFWMGASPLETINRKPDSDALAKIEKLCKDYNTDTILIGIPYNMDGSLGHQAKDCLNFIRPLENKKYKILYQDERLSSFEAEEMLKQKNVKYTKNKAEVDKVAACVILNNYLSNNKDLK